MSVSVVIAKDTGLRGLSALAQRIATLSHGRSVLVGVPEGPKEEDGTSIAMIAAVHEFGAPERGIPERSFIRAGIRRNLEGIKALNVRNLRAFLDGRMDGNTALGRLGLFVASKVQEEIIVGSFAPLAPSTIKRKGSSRPLVDTGQLRASITWKIDDGSGVV